MKVALVVLYKRKSATRNRYVLHSFSNYEL